MAGRSSWLGAVAIPLAALAAPCVAQGTSGVLFGVVRDSTGVRVSGVEIVQLGVRSPARTISGDSGAYRLTGLPEGALRIQIRRLGYAAETTAVVMLAGETKELTLAFTHAVAASLTPVVTEDRLRGKMAAFHTRRERGVGAFITRAQIDARHPASISELLRYIPGVGVTQRMAGEPQPIHMRRSVNSSMQANCVVQLYVDGQRYENGSVDDFHPTTVEGLEVYRSASEIPAAFRARDGMCGVIAIWTRDPETARRR